MVRRIHDFHDFRGDPFHHDFESLSQGHLRGRASLAAAAHGDEKLPLADVHDRNLPAVVSDGTIDFPVQEFLNGRVKLGVGPFLRTGVNSHLQDRRHSGEQLRPDGRPDGRFQSGPRSARLLTSFCAGPAF